MTDGCEHGEIKIPIAIGDRLWVRETHAYVGSVDPGWLLYRANGYENECIRHGFDRPFPPENKVTWRPSIFMHRKVSRLTLTVTDVRVQRLHDISEADAKAEGPHQHEEWPDNYYTTWRGAFAALWNSINGRDAWDANPWVAAYTFTAQHGNIDEVAT